MERVAQHHLVAEGAGLGGLERPDHGLGGEGDEGRRADLAVGEAQRAGAGARARIAGADREGGRRHATPQEAEPCRAGRPVGRTMPTMARSTEGTVAFRGFRTWYRVEGDLAGHAEKLPLLVLHGGPGFPHDYLEDLAVLADGGRPVIFYDQIGCGRSDHPDDPGLWVMPTFVEEVGAVRAALGLDRVHLLGHSWGGWLALEYALGHRDGLVSLILASTCASLPAYAAEARRLKASLPAAVQEVLDRHEAEGTTGDARLPGGEHGVLHAVDHAEAALAGARHAARSPTSTRTSTTTMQGPEWNITGNLRDWDVTARLGELDLPVLVTSGRYDGMTPAVVRPLVEGIRERRVGRLRGQRPFRHGGRARAVPGHARVVPEPGRGARATKARGAGWRRERWSLRPEEARGAGTRRGPPPSGLAALDRGLGLAHRDRDLARLALLGLGDPHLEHAVGERGGHRLRVDALRQREGAREAAEGALQAVVALLLLLVLGLALARAGSGRCPRPRSSRPPRGGPADRRAGRSGRPSPPGPWPASTGAPGRRRRCRPAAARRTRC